YVDAHMRRPRRHVRACGPQLIWQGGAHDANPQARRNLATVPAYAPLHCQISTPRWLRLAPATLSRAKKGTTTAVASFERVDPQEEVEPLLGGLTPPQREAVEHERGPLLILAG